MLVVLVFLLLVGIVLFLFGELLFTILAFIVLTALLFGGIDFSEVWAGRLWDWFLTQPISSQAALFWCAYFILVSVALHWVLTRIRRPRPESPEAKPTERSEAHLQAPPLVDLARLEADLLGDSAFHAHPASLPA